MLRQYFDRDSALQSHVAGAINFAHPSRAQRRLYLVGSEFGTRREGHNARIIALLRAFPAVAFGTGKSMSPFLTFQPPNLARAGPRGTTRRLCLSALHPEPKKLKNSRAESLREVWLDGCWVSRGEDRFVQPVN